MDSSIRRWLAPVLVVVLFIGLSLIRGVAQPGNDFHFSILGDRTGGAQPQIHGRVWYEVNLLNPDFVITVGDSIEGGRDERAVAEWQALKKTWNRYQRFPLYLTPGNHDIWSDASRDIYEEQTRQKPYYSFTYQDAHFTVLDNSRTTDLSPEQLQFLEEDLKKHKARAPKFVFFHKPYWILPVGTGNSDFPLHRIAREYGVNYVIAGHGHQFVRLQMDGITYMEVGSSGGNMTRGLLAGQGFNQGWFYHHAWVRVKGGQTHITVKEIGPPFGQGRMFDATKWGMNGPQFNPADPAIDSVPET